MLIWKHTKYKKSTMAKANSFVDLLTKYETPIGVKKYGTPIYIKIYSFTNTVKPSHFWWRNSHYFWDFLQRFFNHFRLNIFFYDLLLSSFFFLLFSDAGGRGFGFHWSAHNSPSEPYMSISCFLSLAPLNCPDKNSCPKSPKNLF